MKSIKAICEYIDEKQVIFSQHPFFSTLENCQSVEEFLKLAADLSFWVMAFQDVLRLNEARVQDPYLHKLARHHRIEDRGHEQWFLNDIAKVDQQLCDIRGLFNAKNTITRDATYAIVSEVFNLQDEHLRIVLLLILESTGHIFFRKTAQFVEKHGYSGELRYFSTFHLDVEEAHALFETEMEKQFLATPLSVENHRDGVALVNRIYAAFTQMFDGLTDQFHAQATAVHEQLEEVYV